MILETPWWDAGVRLKALVNAVFRVFCLGLAFDKMGLLSLPWVKVAARSLLGRFLGAVFSDAFLFGDG